MKLFHALMISAGLLLVPAVHADTHTDIGVSIVNGQIRNFYLAIGNYFDVPERDVIVMRDRYRHFPDYDLPVVYYISRHAHVVPELVIQYRLAGHSWLDVTLHFGLSPEIYYVPVHEVYGPPYGKAYGYYKNVPRKDWRHVRLDDDDVVNLVNLRFISDHYGYSPEDVMRLRSGGKSFVVINEDIRNRSKERKDWEGKYRDGRGVREPREASERNEARDRNEVREQPESRQRREVQELRDSRGGRDARESRDTRGSGKNMPEGKGHKEQERGKGKGQDNDKGGRGG